MNQQHSILCACGSGLRRVRCCDPAPHDIAPVERIQELRLAASRSAHLLMSGDVAAAEQGCLAILEAAPQLPDALWVLHQICDHAGRETAALALLQRLVAANPNHLDATQALAMRLFLAGELDAAEVHARNTVRLAPSDPRSHNLMGMILTEAQRPQAGEFHYRKVLELSGARDPIVLANLAWNLKGQGKIAAARRLYEESSAAAPGVFQTLLGWGQLEEADQKFAAASSLLEQAAALRPDDPGLALAQAALLARQGDKATALLQFERAIDGSAHASADGQPDPYALLAKGRLLDQMQRYDEAFGCFDVAKRIMRGVPGAAYQQAEATDILQRLGGFFTKTRIAHLPQATVRRDCPQPVFILGFPRSGTTLLEQVLSSHSMIAAGDELPFINELSQTMPRLLNSPLAYPEALAELWMGNNRLELDALRDVYLRKAAGHGAVDPERPWFTDKMPLNETHLGLIALMFPKSPLIHMHRHPMDVVLSAFSHQLTHGYNCTTSLETTARHYVSVMALVEHYVRELQPRYLSVRYEDLVADLRGGARTILDFIGVPFDERCVEFQNNQRLPNTPSYAQVSERLYTRSTFRYRNYRRQLEPVVPILSPVIERLGYVLD
jgi:tetratricopeptide (TPR) repeat protein